MFTAADIHGRLRATPFVPFQIVTSAGERFDVPHPELVVVFRRFVEIIIPEPDGEPFPDRSERVSILHITSVKHLPVGTRPPGSNGTPIG